MLSRSVGLCLLSLSLSAFPMYAQEKQDSALSTPPTAEDYPDRMLELVKTGDWLTADFSHGTCALCLFQSQKDIDLLEDVSKLSRPELLKKYPILEKEIEQVMKQMMEAAKKRINLKDVSLNISPRVSNPKLVLHVGSDYVVLKDEQDENFDTIVVAKDRIASVRWIKKPYVVRVSLRNEDPFAEGDPFGNR